LTDPFTLYGAVPGNTYWASRAYEMGFSTPGQRAGDLDNLLKASVWTTRDMFVVHSFGPDMTDHTDMTNFGGLNAAGQPYAPARIYDPTNGTISLGDIYRIQAPPVFVRYYTVQGLP